MGSEQRHALGSAIRLILLHFLKLAHSPARDPRRGWLEEVSEYRIQMQSRLEDSPGLRRYLPDLLSRGWRDARRQAVQALRRDRVGEADIPEACPFTLEQVMDPDFFPANRHGLE